MSEPLLLIALIIWPAVILGGVLTVTIRIKRKIERELKWAKERCDLHSTCQSHFERQVRSDLETLLKDLHQRRNAEAKARSEKARQQKEAQALAKAIINPS